MNLVKALLGALASTVFFLQELCKQLHEQIDISEEERYCIEFKLNMVLNEVRHIFIPAHYIDLGSCLRCSPWLTNVDVKKLLFLKLVIPY